MYLQIKFQFDIRDDNFCDALSKLDIKDTKSHWLSPKKMKVSGEYITLGPNKLLYYEGYDKCWNYGIKIYASIDAYS